VASRIQSGLHDDPTLWLPPQYMPHDPEWLRRVSLHASADADFATDTACPRSDDALTYMQ